jgi:DNA-binding Lrp family transcriptional regulator
VNPIIDALRSDPRATAERIAVMTGMDAATVREQIAEWEGNGTLRYKVIIDPRKARVLTGTEAVTALIDVSVSPERGEGYDKVAARIAQFPEVRSVCLVSGGQDLRCEVAGTSMAEIGDFVARKLATIDRVRSTATHFVMKTYKDDGALFLQAAEDHRLKVAP